MAKKRFTDIEIWDKTWYMELTPKLKCLMKYIFDKCDASGCWKPNWKLASLHIGESVNFSDLQYLPKDQYEIIDNGKIFIPDFINFQYGQLSKKSPAHNPIFSAIEKNNLSNRVFNRVSHTLQEKEEEEYMEKEEEKEQNTNISNFINKIVNPDSFPNWSSECNEFLTSETFKSSFSKLNKIPIGNLEKVMMDFIININQRGLFKDCKGIISHFKNFYPKHVGGKINVPSFSNSKGFIDVPDNLDYDNMETW